MQRNLFGQPTVKGTVLGCDACPANSAPGIVKILGMRNIRQRRAMLWAQSPGRTENDQHLELVGKSGQLLWDTLEHVGLSRDDFDIQNVIRCWPRDPATDQDYETNSSEFKQMLRCCSPFNSDALDKNQSNADVHLILGEVAGQQLLGNAYRKDTPVFWHAPWDAYVVLNAHPSFILRSGAKGWRYYAWRDRFRAVAAILKYPGQYGFIHSLDNTRVTNISAFDAMEKHIRAEAKMGRRISVDIEDGIVDGKPKCLVIGFGTGHYEDPQDWTSWEGKNFCVVLDHPEVEYPASLRDLLVERTKRLLEDFTIKKTLQNGSYDRKRTLELLGSDIRGYNFDTRYGTYIRYSFLKSFSLEAHADNFMPEFSGYKSIVDGYKNYADIPLDILQVYNGADVSLTKRMEELIAPQVPSALVQVYIYCSMTLDKMEQGGGPWVDFRNIDKATLEVNTMIQELDRKLQHIAGDPNFNCDSPDQVAWLIYDHLKLVDKIRLTDEERQGMGRSTSKDILDFLALKTKSPVPDLVSKRRALGKLKGTYLVGYSESAKRYNGRLKTVWWLTGAVTGRLRSGRGEKAEAEGIVNMQNIHGNALLQNVLVSDPNWRDAL